MIDARNIYRKVTRKIYDFSPEQLRNILAIFWLYRDESERFRDLVRDHLERMFMEAAICFEGDHSPRSGRRKAEKIPVEVSLPGALPEYIGSLESLSGLIAPILRTSKRADVAAAAGEFEKEFETFRADIEAFRESVDEARRAWASKTEMAALRKAVKETAVLAEKSRDLVKQADLLFKLVSRCIEAGENGGGAGANEARPGREVARGRKIADEARHAAVEQLKEVRYFHKQAAWLTERFPNGTLVDVEGLVRLVDRKELAKNDWSLTPGRYVGVAPEEEDEDFDFEEALREIHLELQGLNEESAALAARIARNFEELGV